MKNFRTVTPRILFAAVFVAMGTFTFHSGAQVVEKKTMITGVISCRLCAGNHTLRTRKGPNQDGTCTRTCVLQRSGYAIVRSGDVYLLKGNLAHIQGFVGDRVTVTGTSVIHDGHKELNVVSIH
jgi:hypothetical protein